MFSKIIPSFFTIKEGFFRIPPSPLQGELHFLPKPLFLRKRGCNCPTVLFFDFLRLPLAKGSSTSNQAFLLRRKDVTALSAIFAPPVPPQREGPYPIPKP